MYQSHIGAGILAGFFAFILLSAIFSLYAPLCRQSGGVSSCATAQNLPNSAAMGFGTVGGVVDANVVTMLTGSSILAFLPLFAEPGSSSAWSPVAILLAVVVPVIAGLLAGIISRCGAGGGFLAGFSGVVVGYYIMFILLFLYLLSNGLQISAMTSQMTLPVLGVVLIIPIMVGILGGAAGAMTGAFFGFPKVLVTRSRPVSTVTTTIMQVPSATVSDAAEDLGKRRGQSRSSACPACGAEVVHELTFCQSCGERLK